ncbi:MAG TPA: trypsin-like peptidase domain-containing protein, partial [Pyrinomonadaceae bacterium]|nr:trypsin-like peptidase domain-containing protein [Pyrinomonadaceae bacterium]
MSTEAGLSLFARWFESLRESDPKLHEELSARLQTRAAHPEAVASADGRTLESVAFASDSDVRAMALETIVREGRPALLIRDNRISPEGKAADAAAEVVVRRLREAAPVVEPLIPLVGRIDVENYPGPFTYVGTGWLIDRNVVVTNRHVAELLARSDNGQFRFRPGRFGEDLRVAVDYRHEHLNDARSVARVRRVIWIESNPQKADFALLEVERRTDGTTPEFIPLADTDAAPNSDVAVVGYPARAPAHVIPDQAWMDQIYGSTYDVKRIAPGLMGANNRGWATHDCTTLGGNSGSAVIDTKTGRAVALHFAGLYMIENYAVPASTLRDYLKRRPWQGESAAPAPRPDGGPGGAGTQTPAGVQVSSSPPGGGQQTPASGVQVGAAGCQVSMTIPLTITVSLGAPQISGAGQTPGAAGGASSTTSGGASGAAGTTPEPPRDIEEAAQRLHREHGGEGPAGQDRDGRRGRGPDGRAGRARRQQGAQPRRLRRRPPPV